MLRRWLSRTLSTAAVMAAPSILILPAALLADEPAKASPEREALFKKLDANGDGQITKDEVPEEQQRLFERLLRSSDKDGDGKLSSAEFLTGTTDQPRRREAPPERPAGREGAAGEKGRGEGGPESAEIFKRLDANNDGKLVADEVPEERRQGFLIMIERADSDGDKSLTLEEFTKARAMMREGGPPPGGSGERQRPPVGPGGGEGAIIIFRTLDTNGDGTISREEIYAAADSLKKLDRDNDGSISRQEAGAGGPGQMAGGPGGRPGRPGEGGGRPGEGGGNVETMVANMLRNADKDSDGKISKEEAPERMKENFARMDANSDGFIDEAELKQVFGRMRQGGAGGPGGAGAGRAGGGMRDMDKNGDGKISKDEAPERMKENFDKIDTNSDGQLDQEELQKWFASMRQRGEGGRPRGDNDNK